MQVVAVRMRLACEHLTHIQALQTTLDTLYLFQCVDFETCGRECVGHLLGCQVKINVFLQPFVGNIHYTDSLVITNL